MITAPRRPQGHDTAQGSRNRPGQAPALSKRANFIYFWPLYTGTAIPIEDWRSRMWLDTWV